MSDCSCYKRQEVSRLTFWPWVTTTVVRLKRLKTPLTYTILIEIILIVMLAW